MQYTVTQRVSLNKEAYKIVVANYVSVPGVSAPSKSTLLL